MEFFVILDEEEGIKYALSQGAYINTAKITTIKTVPKEIYNRENTQQTIYTDSHNSIKSIKFNKKKHPLKPQGKNITLCKIPAPMSIKDNEATDKAAKEYYPAIKRVRNFKQQKKYETKGNKFHQTLYERVGNCFLFTIQVYLMRI